MFSKLKQPGAVMLENRALVRSNGGKGLSIKTSEVRGVSSANKRGRGFFKCERKHFWVQKTSDFS